MNRVLRIVAILMLIVGVTWILQGFNILPGSFMTGQLKWAGYGSAVLVAGAVLFAISRRR